MRRLHATGVLVCLVALTWSQPAHGIQDDVYVPLRSPFDLFRNNPEEGVKPMAEATSHVDLAIYPLGMGYQRWHGLTGGDIALMAVGPNLLWRAGFSVMTLADHRNEISFRLTRLYYEVRIGADMKVWKGVLRARWVHRCSHGADDAISGRILIRSGPNVGYHHVEQWGRLRLDIDSHIHTTIAARNYDESMHWRGNWTGRSQVTWQLSDHLELLGAAGLVVMLVSQGESDIYVFTEPIRRLRVEPLPAGMMGIRYTGSTVPVAVTLHAHRVLDTGITLTAKTTDLFAIRFLIDW
ncbi:MAG: hypothetical protein VYE15_06185 [Myxococcota bacterium]|nr:hypothetical protein [Myxococcota bacterium]